MQITRNHFLAGPRLTKNQYAGIGVGDLLHHLPHVLNCAAGTYQTAEQVRFTMTAALAGLVVHLAIDLGAVQRIEQLAVAGRHFEGREDSPAQILGQFDRGIFAHQQHRKELIPCRDGLKKPLQAARCIYATDKYAQYFSWRRQRADYLLPVLSGTGEIFFAKKIQDNRQIPAALAIVID